MLFNISFITVSIIFVRSVALALVSVAPPLSPFASPPPPPAPVTSVTSRDPLAVVVSYYACFVIIRLIAWQTIQVIVSIFVD